MHLSAVYVGGAWLTNRITADDEKWTSHFWLRYDRHFICTPLLHFVWSVAEAKCILATAVRVCVCFSLHSHTTARTRM